MTEKFELTPSGKARNLDSSLHELMTMLSRLSLALDRVERMLPTERTVSSLSPSFLATLAGELNRVKHMYGAIGANFDLRETPKDTTSVIKEPDISEEARSMALQKYLDFGETYKLMGERIKEVSSRLKPNPKPKGKKKKKH